MNFLLTILAILGATVVVCQNDIFFEKSSEIATLSKSLNLKIEISDILKRNYPSSPRKCKYDLQTLIISNAIRLRKRLMKRSLKEDSGEIVREIVKFGQEHPGISASLIGISQNILRKCSNLKLSDLKADSFIFPVLYSLGFLTTGYILGMFKEIQDYFLKGKK